MDILVSETTTPEVNLAFVDEMKSRFAAVLTNWTDDAADFKVVFLPVIVSFGREAFYDSIGFRRNDRLLMIVRLFEPNVLASLPEHGKSDLLIAGLVSALRSVKYKALKEACARLAADLEGTLPTA